VVDYSGFFRWFFLGRTRSATVELARDIPWTLGVDGGIAHSDFDLRALVIERVEVSGGVANVEIQLGAPRGVVPIRIRGGAARFRATYPAGTGARVRIAGGAAKLVVGEQRFGAIGGPVELETRGWDGKNGYDIKVEGGAAHLEVIQAITG
jgi:hypothetical protein